MRIFPGRPGGLLGEERFRYAPGGGDIAAAQGLVAASVVHVGDQRGIGTFVADGARTQLIKQRQTEFADRYLKPLIAEAARLGISATDLAALIKEEA